MSSSSAASSSEASSASSSDPTSTSTSSKASFTPAIPNSANNPFLSTTSLPEGTLFIAVGSILLGIILTILLWRVYAIWASHRAAKYNEAHFTALEPSYGGPFKDPVVERDASPWDEHSDSEKPDLHPIGVPLNAGPRKPRRPRPKSQAERLREAQLQGKFFSPTAEVLTHGTGLPSNLALGTAASSNSSASFLPNGYYGNPHSSRLSVMHSGRNSMVQHSSMSAADSGAPSIQEGAPFGPPEGSSNPPSAANPRDSRARKLRPPSTYLDDLIG